MKLFITGICGFVGCTLARAFREQHPEIEVFGIDNFCRPGSWLNREPLQQLGVTVFHGDIRNPSDLESLPKADWVIDAAANASVLAGVDGKTSSRQLVEHNLLGTVNLLEYCRRHQAGFVLLSTSRVYSIPPLANLRMRVVENDDGSSRYAPDPDQEFPAGLSPNGISEDFSTAAPVSLYGATKLASEQLALEYGHSFQFPVWINRCGVMAGAGQFGHPAQGIFAFWIHSFREGRPLKYIGFDGHGRQVRDCFHPKDLVPLLRKQFAEPLDSEKPRVCNVAGGIQNSMSLSELTAWCQDQFPESKTVVGTDPNERPFDIPWMVLDPQRAERVWGWEPGSDLNLVVREIKVFSDVNSTWLETFNFSG